MALKFFFHLASFIHFVNALVYDTYNIVPQMEYRNTYGGRWKFLTFINTVLQCVFFGVCILSDVCELQFKRTTFTQSLVKMRDAMFTSIAFPLAMFVTLTFWGIYAVDRQLVYPRHLDGIIPVWYNHSVHTVIAVLAIVEMYMNDHKYLNRKSGMSITVGVGILYNMWVLWIAHHANVWVYPILKVLDNQMRLGFFAVLWLSLACIYLFGEYLHKTFWRTAKKTTVRKKKA